MSSGFPPDVTSAEEDVREKEEKHWRRNDNL